MDSQFFFSNQIKGKQHQVILVVLLSLLAADLVINQVSDVLKPVNVSIFGISLFAAIFIVYAISQHKLLNFLKSIDKNVRKVSRIIRIIYASIKLEQLFMVTILLAILIEIILFSTYNTILVTTSVAVSYIFSIMVLTIFSIKFFKLYKSDRKSKAVLLFGIAFALSAFHLVIMVSVEMLHLIDQESVRTATSKVFFPDTAEQRGTLFQTLTLTLTFNGITKFALLIAAATLLLHHYSEKTGKVKFWILQVLPLLYYLVTIIDFLGIYAPETENEVLIYYSLASVNGFIGGGILFAIPFLNVARKMREDDPIKKYLRVSAYGFILFLGLSQTTMFVAPYPPFGLAVLSISPLAAYMISVGIYSTAVSMSQNMRLRQSIRRTTLGDSNLLGSMGTTQMNYHIRRIADTLKDLLNSEERQLAQKSGVETNISGQEIEDYMKLVLEETKEHKKITL